jgi:hypothetical protein
MAAPVPHDAEAADAGRRPAFLARRAVRPVGRSLGNWSVMMGEQRQKTSAGKPRVEDDRDDSEQDDPVEESIEDTFPASDPPSWSTPAPPPPEDRPPSPDPKSK